MTKKLFTEKQAAIAAAIAGPIPAGILIYLNYKALGKDKEAIVSLAISFLFTLLLFYVVLNLPEAFLDKIPNALFTALYGVIILIFFRNFMSKDIQEAMDEGAKKRSGWAVAGISILGFVLSIGVIFGFAMEQPFYEGEVVEVNGNELYHDADIPKADINKFLTQLQTQDYFGEDYENVARLELIADDYFITLVVDEELWSDQGVITSATSLKWMMEIELKKKIHLKLESISLTGDHKLKYIDQKLD